MAQSGAVSSVVAASDSVIHLRRVISEPEVLEAGSLVLRSFGTNPDRRNGMNLPRRRPPSVAPSSGSMLRCIHVLVIPEQPSRHSHPVTKQCLVERLCRP